MQGHMMECIKGDIWSLEYGSDVLGLQGRATASEVQKSASPEEVRV